MFDISHNKEINSYLKAAYALAKQQFQEDKFCADAISLQKVFQDLFPKDENKYLKNEASIKFSILNKSKQKQFMGNLLEQIEAGSVFINLVNLFVISNKFELLKNLVLNWEYFYAHLLGYTFINVISAVELNEQQQSNVNRIVEEKVSGGFLITYKVEQKILGGLVLYINDKIYDDSIATKLREIKSKVIGKSL